MSEATNKAHNTSKRGRGRPPKNQASNVPQDVRPTRVPVHEQRDKITVQGKRDDLEYRWVQDGDEAGQRIAKFKIGGWDFVKAKDVQVGQAWVHESTYGGGSLIRRPASEARNTYYYLMAIEKEFFDEDQLNQQADIYDREREMLYGDPGLDEDQTPDYGKTKINNPHRRQV